MTTPVYISFDGFPEASLNKEREMCFTAGSAGQNLSQHITDNKERHGKNVAALENTLRVCADLSSRRRFIAALKGRLEQERKWAKHFDTCIDMHKKGKMLADLKKALAEEQKKRMLKERADRDALEKKLVEVKKQTREEAFKEFEANRKAKNKKAKKEKKKSNWFKRLWDALFKPKKKEEEEKKPMDLKQLTAGMSVKEKRTFMMKRREEQMKKDGEKK